MSIFQNYLKDLNLRVINVEVMNRTELVNLLPLDCDSV